MFILQVAICWWSMCWQIRPDLGAQSTLTLVRINGCNSRAVDLKHGCAAPPAQFTCKQHQHQNFRPMLSKYIVFLAFCADKFWRTPFVKMCIVLVFPVSTASSRSIIVTGDSMKLVWLCYRGYFYYCPVYCA